MKRQLALACVLGAAMLFGQDHHHGVNQRGDRVMGFSHETTTHHFLLVNDGGTIQVEANDAKDTQARDQIRQHLKHISTMFSAGNFDAPLLIHGQVPPGVPVMKRLGAGIDYKFGSLDRGDPLKAASDRPQSGTLKVP